jgi:hypothetical protein
MAIVPFAGATAGGGLAWLIGAIRQAILSRGGAIAAGAAGASLAEMFGIDPVRREAVRISPLSDPEALEEAARILHWMMGVADNDVIGPRDIRNWNYFHYNPRNGRAWWTRSYRSSKSMRSARGRGARRGFRSGLRRAKVGY